MADKFGTFATHAAVALFKTALIPTAGQKMTALTVMFRYFKPK